MKMKRIMPVLLTLALLIVLCSCGSNQLNIKTMSYSDAKEELAVLAANVRPIALPVRLDPNEMFDLDLSSEVQTLPDISEFPFIINPASASYITVYSENPLIIQAASDFNEAASTVMFWEN